MRALFFLLLATFVALPSSAQESKVQSATNVYVADGLVHYSLTNNAVVPADEKTATNWDILINGVELHANRAGLVVSEAFDAIAEAPLEGMKNSMMKTADGEVWYNYDMNTHEISPKGEMTFVLMLADDSYAKLTVDSYYHRITEEPRYMSFRYVIADGGERSFMD
ncbi:MAG: hypothetical protein HKN29_01835 [Rhodothermales bacterium]|nr:hypothetical protein [Rhodothermales bacterium]